MATFTADKAKSGVPARKLHAGNYTEVCIYTSSATMSAGDIIQMCKVQAGERVVDWKLVSLTEPMLLSMGDGVDADRYVASATITTTLATQRAIDASLNYEYSADDTVDVIYGAGQTANAAVVILAHITKVSDN